MDENRQNSYELISFIGLFLRLEVVRSCIEYNNNLSDTDL